MTSTPEARELLQNSLPSLREMRERYQNDLCIDDHGHKFNTDLTEAWELGSLIDLAEVTTLSAINRTESRGGHSREDYPKRDDESWMKHTLTWADEATHTVRIDYRPVHTHTMTNEVSYIPPKTRSY